MHYIGSAAATTANGLTNAPPRRCADALQHVQSESPASQVKRELFRIANGVKPFSVEGSIQVVAHARVPIVHFVDRDTGLPCDISIQAHGDGAHYRSQVLQQVYSTDARIARFIRMVRAWAAANGINEAANGTLNSYSLSMMALYHMQTVEGSATPALDALLGHNGELPAAINAETCGIAAVTAACSKHVERMPADEEQASLAELFLGFLLHYDALMSVWDCGLPLRVCPRTATMRCEPFEKSNPLAVEDPFDTNSNTASAVRAGGGAFRVRRAFLEGASFADETKRWTSTSRAAADAHVARLFESGPARSSSTADKSTILKPRRKSRSARRPVQSSNTNPQPSVGRRRRRV